MTGNYESVQAKAIAEKGHEVSVISIKWRNPLHLFEYDRVNHRVVDGIQVYECTRITLSIPHIYLPKIEQKVMEWQFERVYRVFEKEQGRPDIVHGHIIRYAAPAINLKTKLHLPFVITEHWSALNADNTYRRTMNQTFAYKQADKVICVSDVLADKLKSKCGVNSLVINNMVSEQFFLSKKEARNDGEFRFVSVSALRRKKRFDILVRAFASCQFPESVSLDIVGDGKDRPVLERMIQDLNLGKQVRLLGMKTPEEVSRILCRSDCFVLSSSSETFSIALIEALAKGLPVVSTKCGGPETFIRDEDGVLVENENAEDLAKGMKYMMSNIRYYDSEEIRQHCYDNFSQNVIANKIIDVYNQVLK